MGKSNQDGNDPPVVRRKAPSIPTNMATEFPDANQATSSTQLNSLTIMQRYGLFEFPSRTDQPKPSSPHPNAQSADIVAIHGLGGSWLTTRSAGEDNNPMIWLRDRLPEVLARVNVHPRIRAFGYDSPYVFTQKKKSKSDLR
ncbi:hypothetical protein M434DRAFT_29794 [Hypoxylon sp. CO27-5]|nr:hypothetical protein M434DRAFT_29794 [Hypoxylon sp. CO27-5]